MSAASVVVPTRDRPEALAACLAALRDQDHPSFEVVVVDDASRDPAAVDAVVATVPGARVVRGAGRGPAVARNLGVRAASAPAVCFTDDDCRPEPGWLSALVHRLDDGAVAVAGRTVNGRPHDSSAAAAQVVTSHLTESSLDPRTGVVGFAPTCNLAARADLLGDLPFDESFPSAAGEDRDWCARLAARGDALVYEPAALVLHHPSLSVRGFWRQQVRYGRGGYRGRQVGAVRSQPWRFYPALIRRGFDHGPRVGALVVTAQVATAVGMVREAVSTRRR